MEVIRRDNISVKRFVNPFKGSNTFLLELDESPGIWLFDIGDSSEIFHAIGSRKLNGIFLTHSHFDHIKGIKLLLDLFPQCTVYGSRKCIEWLRNDKRNLSFYYESSLKLNSFSHQVLSDGDTVCLGNQTDLTVLETPGHSEDSVCYKVKGFMVSGDSYIPNVPPVTKLKGGNKEMYQRSLLRIKANIAPNTILLPGHGKVYYGSMDR